MIRSITKTQLVTVLLIAVIALGSACSHRQTVQVGSHKVTIARHGFTRSFHADPEAGTFWYEGTSLGGTKYKISINGDRVKVNDKDYGMLRKNDSVVIGDHGLTVNSMDYGESEKYLRSNGSQPVQAAIN